MPKFEIRDTSCDAIINTTEADTKEDVMKKILESMNISIIEVESTKECPECGWELRSAMLDTDGTNLVEGYECTNPDCDYEGDGQN